MKIMGFEYTVPTVSGLGFRAERVFAKLAGYW